MKPLIQTPAIFLYSASDRFNYGDLMYQIIFKKILDEILGKGCYLFFNFALTESKQSHLEAEDTINVNELWNEKYKIYQNKYLFIGGGDVIPIPFSSMKTHYNKNVDFSPLMEKIKYPFIIDDDYILSNYKVIYQSIGGSSLEGIIPCSITKGLEKASYIFTRDLHTKERLGIKKIKQYPDLVSLMSKFYSKESLDKYTSMQFINWKKIYDIKKYIVFQCSLAALGDVELVDKQLKQISDKTNLPIVLLSIGNCNSHDDLEALKKINSLAHYNCIVIEPKTVLEVSSIISKSSLFIGSSLHGCITAQTYDVPLVPLSKTIPKLQHYLSANSLNRLYHKKISTKDFSHDALNNIKEHFFSFDMAKKYSGYMSDLYSIFDVESTYALESSRKEITNKRNLKTLVKQFYLSI